MSFKNQKPRSDAESFGLNNESSPFGEMFLSKKKKSISRADLKAKINTILGPRKPIMIDAPQIVHEPIKTPQVVIKTPQVVHDPIVNNKPRVVEEPKQKKVKYFTDGLTLPDGRIVPDTKRNRSLLNKLSNLKIYNPFTKRWITDTPQNRKKLEDLKSKEVNEITNVEKIQSWFRNTMNNRRKRFTINVMNDLSALTEGNKVHINTKEALHLFDLKSFVRELLNCIDKTLHNKQVILKVSDQIYTLNDSTRLQLLRFINENILQEVEASNSWEEMKYAIVGLNDIDISLVSQNHSNRRNNGSFFPYYNNTIFDLSHFQIFRDDKESDYKDTCLVHALKEGGLSTKKLQLLKPFIKNRNIPVSDFEKICNKVQIKIILKKDDNDRHLNRRVFGKKFKEEYNIGLIMNHFFLIEPMNITTYAINNYRDIVNEKNFNLIYAKQNGYYVRNRNRCGDSYDIIKALARSITCDSIVIEVLNNLGLNDVSQLIHSFLGTDKSLLTPIGYENTNIASTQFYDKIEPCFDCLEYNVDDCTRPVEGKKKQNREIEDEEHEIVNVFFDFETDTSGDIHVPYGVCFKYDNKTYWYEGPDCGLKMLMNLSNKLLYKVRLIAHNATYDYRFIIRYLKRIHEISNGNRLIAAEGYFEDMKVQIKDSYALIQMPLRDFGKTFNLNIEKEIMPYDLYTTENINKRIVKIDEALQYLNAKDHEQFKHNMRTWNVLVGEDSFDIVNYSKIYCEMDVKVLEQGYDTFRTWMLMELGIDINTTLTISSLAQKYFINEGCYKDVFELGGTPQMFIQRSVIGGRTMCNENKKLKFDKSSHKRMNDFDAVSLYASAMHRMPGFLKGIPKVLKFFKYDDVKGLDGYFVDVKIINVGIKRQFPLMSYKNEKGVRVFTNDMIGRVITVDKTQLEDLIKFHEIDFQILRGYYFNEGFNTKIRNCVHKVFTKRLEMKAIGNPMELIYKLLLNSGYGKNIMKPVDTETQIFDSIDRFDVFLSRNYNWIRSYEYFGEKVKVKMIKTINDHFNIPHVGTSILSMSKRIMNEVMCLAEDLGIFIYYQDTDSMHLLDSDIKLLTENFNKQYNRELIGKQMGQFHSDFKMEGCKNVVAVSSIFLGKKSYIDVLEGTNTFGNIQYGYHIRMKGVPSAAITYKAEELGITPFELYNRMYNSEKVEFDITKGHVKFIFKSNYTIATRRLFLRTVKF